MLHCTASDRQMKMIEGECHSPLAGRQTVRITPRCSVESVEEENKESGTTGTLFTIGVGVSLLSLSITVTQKN